MWRHHAALRATIIAAVLIVAACVGWAVLAQTLTTPACALPTPPPNVGTLVCPNPAPTP